MELDDSSLAGLVKSLRDGTDDDVFLLVKDASEVPKEVKERYAGPPSTLLYKVARDLGAGWVKGGNDLVVLSARLRPLRLPEAAGDHIQFDRMIGLAALPRLFKLVGPEALERLKKGGSLKFVKRDNAYPVVKQIADLHPVNPAVISRSNSYDLRIFPDPYVAIYFEERRVPGLVSIVHPRVSSIWQEWTGDRDDALLFTSREVKSALPADATVAIAEFTPIGVKDLVTKLGDAANKEIHLDKRLETWCVLSTRGEWGVVELLNTLLDALYATARRVDDMIIIRPLRYDGAVHRWLDEKMVELLSPVFSKCAEHCGLAPPYITLGHLPPVNYHPFSKSDFERGVVSRWGELTEIQQQFFKKVVSDEVWERVGEEDLKQVLIKCLPGVLLEINRYESDTANGEPLATVDIGFF